MKSSSIFHRFTKIAAFTLIELIVVITILAILATISFLAYEGYTSDARDSKKMEETSELYKGVVLAFTKTSKYPEEATMNSISSGSTVLAKQSYIGKTLASILGASSSLFSAGETNNSDYTYTVNSQRTKAQLTSFLGKQNPSAAMIQTWGVSRYVFARGDSIPVLLGSSDYVPVSQDTDISDPDAWVSAFIGTTSTGGVLIYADAGDLIDNLPTLYISGYTADPGAVAAAPTWSISEWGDCIAVEDSSLPDGTLSKCTDTRVFALQPGAELNKEYSLISIAGKWWFNQNLAYPVAAGYQGNDTWSEDNATAYYSCPGNNGGTTVDCNLVSSLGYLYQWPAIMAGASSTDDKGNRVQGICPSGWAIPTNSDYVSTPEAFWPANTWDYGGTTTNWSRTYAGYRSGPQGTFNQKAQIEHFWTSLESGGSAWYENFNTSYPTKSSHGGSPKSNGLSLRCIKN